MHTAFLNELNDLKNKSYANQKVIELFTKRFMQDGPLRRDEGIPDHFCSFLLPVNLSSQQIFIGHHIKADQWIPPGGHIDAGEAPRDALKREFVEELNYTLTTEKIELFDVSSVDISSYKRPECLIHNDFWYLVFTDLIPFVYDKKEFYTAEWIPIEKAVPMIKRAEFIPIFQKLEQYLQQTVRT